MTEAIKPELQQKLVSLTIDDQEISVPEGTWVVDAAKLIDIDIPVFCYHPKMEPVGMCRMCLVEVGRPMRDRASGELVLEKDGSPKIQFGPKLETGCTVPVSEGMVVRGYTEQVSDARKEVVEFLLTSHPLDCPVCDKGGECPLQNLTMEYGSGKSRFIFDEKIDLAKHVPLGDMIYLDRERCIQCARCTRFQSEIVDDPVIGFSQRGRALEIVTFSDPGFDSYWSGNTTDICPVGALTTADFRFGARPWELNTSASICNHCAVGCNLSINTRREAKTGGDMVIKRIMPRQNESVNEIWICDKGRFGYQYTERNNRITQPMIRKKGKLVPAAWDEVLNLVSEKFKAAGNDLLSVVGGRLSNEDYFNQKQLSDQLGSVSRLYSNMAGGDLVSQVGVAAGTNLADMGPETTILVVASDLEEEAPIWWLRVKQAAQRGATLIVANPRRTKLDSRASTILRYDYGQEADLVMALASSDSSKQPNLSIAAKKLLRNNDLKAAAKLFMDAENAIVIFGSEGAGFAQSEVLSQACANLLISSGHVGRLNNGLIGVWDGGNVQGSWDMGIQPNADLLADLKAAQAVYLTAVDLAGDDRNYAKELTKENKFVVVQELQMTATAELADVVLPAQAFSEREGTYTSGERRVQRFYPAVPAPTDLKPDFGITAEIAAGVGLTLEGSIPALVMLQIADTVSDYSELNYQKLAEVDLQFPIIGRDDVYYGGNAYQNSQGLGVQLQPASQRGQATTLTLSNTTRFDLPKSDYLAVPVTRLYDQGNTITPTEILSARLTQAVVVLHPDDADKLGVEWGGALKVELNGISKTVIVEIDNSLQKGVVLAPRSVGLPIVEPVAITLEAK